MLPPGLLIIHANAQHLWNLNFTHANKAQGSMNNGNPQMTGESDWIVSTVFNMCSPEESPNASSSFSLNILHPSEILGEVIGSKPGLICIPCSLCSPRTGRSNRQEMKRPRSVDGGTVSAASSDQSLRGNVVKTAFPQVPHISQKQ